MWISSKIVGLFQVAKDTVDNQREELAAARAETARLREEVTRTAIMCDWLRMQINQLQVERVGLLEKAYGIRIPIPEIVKARSIVDPSLQDFSFEDIGDEAAQKLGLPTYAV